jgi:two-component system, LuxR family, sensor kinase FixL
MPSTPNYGELQALLDASVDGIVIIGQEGHIQAFNRSAERLFGYRAEDILGRNVSLLMTDPDRRAHEGHVTRYVASRMAKIIGTGREVLAQRKDGTVFPAWLSVGLIEDPVAPRFVGFIQDLTLRRSNEEQARRLQDRLWHVSRLATVGEMASGIAHELNQPLAAIANYAQACDRLLGSSAGNIGEVREALREITGQAVRAGDIIRRLRSHTRQHDGARELSDVNALLEELTELIEPDAKHQKVRYVLKTSNGPLQVQVHRPQIQQVILNLVRNAVEALAETTASPRQVVVTTCRTGDGHIEISVCDNGPGLSTAIAPRLFEPFCTSKAAGTGLGLAVSRRIVDEHGGSLQYRANAPQGTCFVLRIPAAHQP